MKGLHPVSTRGTGTDCCIQSCGPRLTTGKFILQMHAKNSLQVFSSAWAGSRVAWVSRFQGHPSIPHFSSRFWSEKISEKTSHVTPIEADRKRAAESCRCKAVARSENGGKSLFGQPWSGEEIAKSVHLGQPSPWDLYKQVDWVSPGFWDAGRQASSRH